jgi:hypothetical protein
MGEHQQSHRPRIPWNKGKLIGQKAPLKLKEIWAIRIRLQLAAERETSRFSISQSTVSCAGAIWLVCRYVTWRKAAA